MRDRNLTCAAVSLLRMIFSKCGGKNGGLSVGENSSRLASGHCCSYGPGGERDRSVLLARTENAWSERIEFRKFTIRSI